MRRDLTSRENWYFVCSSGQGRMKKKKKNSPATHHKNIVLCLRRPPPPPLPPHIIFIWKNSQLLCSGIWYARKHAEGSLVSICMYVRRGYSVSDVRCVCVSVQISSLKPLGQLKPNFVWNLHGIGEESLLKWSRSFVVLHYCQPPLGGGFWQGFYHKFGPAVQGV